MKRKHKGFLLLESLTALAISILIIFTLNFCVNEQFRILNYWEEKVNADKIILLHLKTKGVSDSFIIKGKKYFFSQQKKSYQVKVNEHVYQIKK